MIGTDISLSVYLYIYIHVYVLDNRVLYPCFCCVELFVLVNTNLFLGFVTLVVVCAVSESSIARAGILRVDLESQGSHQSRIYGCHIR